MLIRSVAMVAGRFAGRSTGRCSSQPPRLYLRYGHDPTSSGVWLPGMTGAAVGMVLPSLSGAAVARLAPARFGVGSAVNQAVRQMGVSSGWLPRWPSSGHARPQIADFHSLYPTHVALALITASCAHRHRAVEAVNATCLRPGFAASDLLCTHLEEFTCQSQTSFCAPSARRRQLRRGTERHPRPTSARP